MYTSLYIHYLHFSSLSVYLQNKVGPDDADLFEFENYIWIEQVCK